MNLPSIKTLERAFPGKGRELRKLLESPAIMTDNRPPLPQWEIDRLAREAARILEAYKKGQS
ncbi:MAG: hypothetical protein PHW66_09475 [Gallionella sp.]|nr:hypothetical protein [Gallionella sp.]